MSENKAFKKDTVKKGIVNESNRKKLLDLIKK